MKPYLGPFNQDHQANNSIRWYQSDNPDAYKKYLEVGFNPNEDEKYRVDGDWGYTFNSLGFRGEEPNPEATFKILVCGCSNTFGTAVKLEQHWTQLFKNTFEAHFPKENVNLLNAGQGGASNDYIARTTIRQSEAIQPDLVIVHWTYLGRKEHLADEGFPEIFHLGPWSADEEIGEDYFLTFSERNGFIEMMKNKLLVQEYLQGKNIPYLFISPEHLKLQAQLFAEEPVCKIYIDQLDTSKLCNFCFYEDDEISLDWARDASHPGPKSQEVFAQKAFSYYKNFILAAK